jgi:hypothetical protein
MRSEELEVLDPRSLKIFLVVVSDGQPVKLSKEEAANAKPYQDIWPPNGHRSEKGDVILQDFLMPKQ